MAVETTEVDVIGTVEETVLFADLSWQVTVIALPFLIGATVLIVAGTLMMDNIGDMLKIGLLWVMFVILDELKPKTE
jgi:hypothetical protein